MWDLDKIILSVPHSGTRLLIDVLFSGVDKYPFFHFGRPRTGAGLSRFKGIAHIPIRDPIDIAISWDSRYADSADPVTKTEPMLQTFDEMLNYIWSGANVVLHRVEDLPRHEESAGPDADVRRTKSSPRIDALIEWMDEPRVELYKQFYDLEWLK